MTESPPTSINLERAAHKKLHTLSKRNNAALKSLQKLASEETLDLFVDTRQDQLLSLLETMPSSTLDDEKKKAKAYQKYLNTVSDDRMNLNSRFTYT